MKLRPNLILTTGLALSLTQSLHATDEKSDFKEGKEFLAANKKKPGVKTQEVKLADGSVAEMQYKVITEGKGETPKSNDVVSVNYRGTLVNGKEFDSSAKHGGQSKFPVTRVVR